MAVRHDVACGTSARVRIGVTVSRIRWLLAPLLFASGGVIAGIAFLTLPGEVLAAAPILLLCTGVLVVCAPVAWLLASSMRENSLRRFRIVANHVWHCWLSYALIAWAMRIAFGGDRGGIMFLPIAGLVGVVVGDLVYLVQQLWLRASPVRVP